MSSYADDANLGYPERPVDKKHRTYLFMARQAIPDYVRTGQVTDAVVSGSGPAYSVWVQTNIPILASTFRQQYVDAVAELKRLTAEAKSAAQEAKAAGAAWLRVSEDETLPGKLRFHLKELKNLCVRHMILLCGWGPASGALLLLDAMFTTAPLLATVAQSEPLLLVTYWLVGILAVISLALTYEIGFVAVAAVSNRPHDPSAASVDLDARKRRNIARVLFLLLSLLVACVRMADAANTGSLAALVKNGLLFLITPVFAILIAWTTRKFRSHLSGVGDVLVRRKDARQHLEELRLAKIAWEASVALAQEIEARRAALSAVIKGGVIEQKAQTAILGDPEVRDQLIQAASHYTPLHSTPSSPNGTHKNGHARVPLTQGVNE